jgi:hypothetical protein
MRNIGTYESPTLQDNVVQSLNTLLADLVEYRFGIAHTGYDEDGKTYPSIYYNDGSKKNMMLFPDNKVKSFCFWEFGGARVLNDDEGIKFDLTLVFWGNLNRIDPIKYFDFTSEIEQSIIQILVNAGAEDINYTEKNVFDKYSKYLENEKQTLMRPNTGFSITMSINDFIC